MQQNGTWYLHVILLKTGYPLDPEDEDYSPQAIAHTSGCKTLSHPRITLREFFSFSSVQQVPEASSAQYGEPHYRRGRCGPWLHEGLVTSHPQGKEFSRVSLQVPQGSTDVLPEILSYYHPNLTINLVDDHTRWVPGSVPQPMDKCESNTTTIPSLYLLFVVLYSLPICIQQ